MWANHPAVKYKIKKNHICGKALTRNYQHILPHPQETRFVSTVVNVLPTLPMPGSCAEE